MRQTVAALFLFAPTPNLVTWKAALLSRGSSSILRGVHQLWSAAGSSQPQAYLRPPSMAPLTTSTADKAASAPVLGFFERQPPFAALAVAKLSGAAVQLKPDAKNGKDAPHTLTFPTGEQFAGTPLIVRYLARAGSQKHTLLPADALQATQVDHWVDFVAREVVSSAGLDGVLAALNDYLAFRTFLISHAVSLADVTLWGSLQGNPMWKKAKASGTLPHLSRWFDALSALPECTAALEAAAAAKEPKVSTRAVAAAAAGGSDNKSQVSQASDLELPGAVEGKVVTRFPPEPSGYLHVGHAKAALLNQHFATKYKGKLLVRFDDTNPSKEKDEFVENIIKDIADLGLKYDKLTYTSDYFPQLLDMGERLIKAGYLYADDTPVELMREERMAKKASKCRGRSVAENLSIWEAMKRGDEVGLANALRFKADMTSVNGAMRDPVAFRCNLTPHWRTGTKYKVYPTYDCACPFVDALEGVTHALRTSEYKDREEQYYWVLGVMQKVWPGLPNVNVWDYSRLNFVHTVLSKRKLTWFVDTGRVTGWDDPRMPTVQGILRRGLQVEALREFILSQGASKNVTFQEWDKIWAMNKKLIDPVCPRHTAVVTAGRVRVTLAGGPQQPEYVTVPRHKKHPPAGKKTQTRTSVIWLEQADARELHDGEEVTLMDWGNAVVERIERDSATGAVSAIAARLHLEGDVKKTKWKLTWLPDSSELVPLRLVDFDYLITKKKVEEEDVFTDLVNPVTQAETEALGDANMRVLQKGEVLQLERKGYYIVDQAQVRAGQSLVLFSIPDGRQKTVGAIGGLAAAAAVAGGK